MEYLVLLDDVQKLTDEGRHMKNALGHPVMQNILKRRGLRAYSLRREDGSPMLSLSVDSNNVCKHVVGYMNKRPSKAQLALLDSLLKKEGIGLDFDPNTIA